MKYSVETEKSIDQTLANLQSAAMRHKFDILRVHDIQKDAKKRSKDFPNTIHVLEISHPQSIQKILMVDMKLKSVLPYRISIYEEDGKTKIGMIKNRSIMKILSDSTALINIVKENEAAITTMIQESV